MIPRSSSNGGYEVHCSTAIARRLHELQDQANVEGRGKRTLAAIRAIWRRLARDPKNLGEPLYHLPALRMQVRTIVIAPLAVDFAVCEDRPLVFIKGVRLL